MTNTEMKETKFKTCNPLKQSLGLDHYILIKTISKTVIFCFEPQPIMDFALKIIHFTNQVNKL